MTSYLHTAKVHDYGDIKIIHTWKIMTHSWRFVIYWNHIVKELIPIHHFNSIEPLGDILNLPVRCHKWQFHCPRHPYNICHKYFSFPCALLTMAPFQLTKCRQFHLFRKLFIAFTQNLTNNTLIMIKEDCSKIKLHSNPSDQQPKWKKNT